ncbi:MAG: translation initiation factor IF-2 [Candidatus Saccharibacteria bacterium]|nr:translation initiation factor IF-2 [Candidatus Saccharibacteria bacterium]
MADKKELQIPDMITVGDLADKLGLPVVKLVGELFKNGIMATVNQRIDFETAEIIIEELGIDAKIVKKDTSVPDVEEFKIHLSDKAKPRPPIVAVMGHVDHGKTTLLDNILGMTKASGEAGGITQHISAYQTVHNDRTITLLDTPGHEAFAALRQHGATLTDVVIIVVAADDGVKPQTVEAIKFARTANAKIVVAINKMDKEAANPTLVKTQLASEYDLNPEEWGGDTVMVEVSAKTGQNIDKLLDMVLLVADMEELKADYNVPAEGLVIESNLEKGRGAVVRLLVENGTLNKGDFIVAGSAWGKIRTLEDWKGKQVKSAGPSTPATVTGFREVPPFGTHIEEVKNEREAKALAAKHYDEEVRSTANANITGADLLKMMNREVEQQEAAFVVKADVQGSLTSVVDSLKLLETDEVAVKIVASGVGDITEGDIRAASSTNKAVIYGFNVNLPAQVKQLAARAHVEVKLYKIIYELLDDAKAIMSSLLPDEVVETALGELEIKGIFRTTKTTIIAGGLVTSGRLQPHSRVRVWRGKGKNAIELGEFELESLKREKNEANDLLEGEMGGISINLEHQKLALELGDRLEVFTRELKKRSL